MIETGNDADATLKRKLARTRRLLIGIVAVNLTALLVALYLALGQPADHQMELILPPQSDNMAKFEVASGKADMERLINRYLQQYAETGSHGLTYQAELSDTLRLRGNVEVMGFIVQLEVELEPAVLENGDLLLTQKRFKIGNLPLPSSLVLEFVRQSFNFPEWISIQPSRTQIHVATNAIQSENGMIIRVLEFDLAADKLEFEILLPVTDHAPHSSVTPRQL